MRLVASFAVLLLLLPQSTLAQSICNALQDLVIAVEAGDADKADLDGVSAAQCGVALGLSGQAERYCYWDYPFRDTRAATTLDGLVQSLDACGAATLDGTSIVNHPDSFDQVAAIWDGQDISVALKDKGGLQRTLIFVRVTAAP